MSEKITVKGIGTASTKPDCVILSLALEARDPDYTKAMDKAGANIEQLTDTFVSAGFAKEDLKTTNFDVGTDYENQQDGERYKNVFVGYVVRHDLKLSFDFTPERLAEALSVVSSCTANPEVSVSFTVKDPSDIHEELLRSAAANARRKAEVLCSAAGTKLGKLKEINYNWGELDVYSGTRYDNSYVCMSAGPKARAVGFEPDDIKSQDTVTFVWEMD